jgi:hypothetical protein
LFGACAAGTQTCEDNTWGPCSIIPAAADTCAPDNDDDCDGNVNEGCPCSEGEMRACSQGGLFGKCADGTQTCSAQGEWQACSIQPSTADTCVQGNDDDCSGTPNDDCDCIENVTTRECGPCTDGTQVCVNGRTNQYSSCTGASAMRTYYRDADGDGYGASAITTIVCGSPPAGYVAMAGDCCDDGGNLALARQINPGQANWFDEPANVCGITWDYNCSGGPETSPATVTGGCATNATYPTCQSVAPSPVNPSSCGMNVGACGCGPSGAGTGCMTGCQGVPVTCH